MDKQRRNLIIIVAVVVVAALAYYLYVNHQTSKEAAEADQKAAQRQAEVQQKLGASKK